MSAIAVALVSIAGGGWGPSQAVIPRLQSISAADSTELHERARDAQRRFERFRIRRLPTRFGSGGPCDERIGRFCMDHRADGLWDFPPENPEIVVERNAFLDQLGEIAAEIPGDRWILGQRVFYLGESGRWEEAITLAAGCEGPDEVWCDGLLGFSLHASRRYVEAETVFERMLERLPADEKARWLDPRVLLDGDARNTLDDLRGDALLQGWDRIWNWSDPYFAIPGNDRLTEHFARRVVTRIRERSLTPYDLRWSDDLEEILLRYGWEVGWEALQPTVRLTRSGSTWGHHHPESRPYVPPGSVLRWERFDERGDWIAEKETPRSGYAPLYAPEVEAVSPPVSVVRRGDSIRVLAPRPVFDGSDPVGAARSVPAYDDPSGDGNELDVVAGLFLVAGPGLRYESEERVGEGFAVRAPSGLRYLLSLEAVDLESGRARRHRRWIDEPMYPAGVPLLSDLIPLSGSGDLPESLSLATSDLRSDLVFAPNDTVRFGWELYSALGGSSSVRFRVQLLDSDGGLFDWIGERLGIGEGDRSLLLEWTEVWPEGADAFFRAVDIALPSLDPGHYLLRLEAELPGRSPMNSERTIEIRRFTR